jgi:hypothetical protein
VQTAIIFDFFVVVFLIFEKICLLKYFCGSGFNDIVDPDLYPD